MPPLEEDLGPECQQEINETIQHFNQQMEEAIEAVKTKWRKVREEKKDLVHKVDSHEEFQKILEKAGENLVVVDFTATWCGPCKRIAPYYKELSEEFTNVVFLKVDVDDNRDTTEECKISSMPTFQFYQKGQKVHEFSGANRDQLRNVIVERSSLSSQ